MKFLTSLFALLALWFDLIKRLCSKYLNATIIVKEEDVSEIKATLTKYGADYEILHPAILRTTNINLLLVDNEDDT